MWTEARPGTPGLVSRDIDQDIGLCFKELLMEMGVRVWEVASPLENNNPCRFSISIVKSSLSGVDCCPGLLPHFACVEGSQ